MWVGRGRTRSLRAFHRLDRGLEAGADADAALADLDEALRLDRSRSEGYEWRGQLRARLGAARAAAGDPSEALFAAAEADFARILPPHEGPRGWPLLHRGAAAALEGEARRRAGRDPMPRWDVALESVDRAVEMLPGIPDPLTERAALRILRARHLARARPEQAREERRAADADLARALAIAPSDRRAAELRSRLPPRRRDRARRGATGSGPAEAPPIRGPQRRCRAGACPPPHRRAGPCAAGDEPPPYTRILEATLRLAPGCLATLGPAEAPPVRARPGAAGPGSSRRCRAGACPPPHH
jgi:tetratricopeptide (TPR) repeat protein